MSPLDTGFLNPFKAVREFHEKFEQDIDVSFTEELVDLRLDLIDEEYMEVIEAINAPIAGWLEHEGVDWSTIDRKALTKELADLLYVTIGAAVTFGLPLEEVFNEVHRSNMTKLTKDGKVLKRADGKVLKSDQYEESKLDQFFREAE